MSYYGGGIQMRMQSRIEFDFCFTDYTIIIYSSSTLLRVLTSLHLETCTDSVLWSMNNWVPEEKKHYDCSKIKYTFFTNSWYTAFAIENHGSRDYFLRTL